MRFDIYPLFSSNSCQMYAIKQYSNSSIFHTTFKHTTKFDFKPFLRIYQHELLPLRIQQLQQSYQPSGCFLLRSVPSFLRELVLMKILRTVHLSAYVQEYLSYRKKLGLQQCYLGEVYVLYHRRMLRRSISYPARYILSCMYLQPDAGNVSGS